MLYKQCLSNLQILLRVRNKNHISFLLFIVKERNNLAFGFYFLSHLVFAIINYSLLEADKVKNYIFAMSNTYDQYLRYLKDYKGEEEYRKEKRRTNELLKKIAPLKKGKFEAELKSEFKLALSKL
ncbi:hypothetical protein DSECCO2_571630 [anaerobic digester metagenome]